MKLIKLRCKNCGALLNIEEGAKEITCEYCHTKFIVDDEIQHIQYDNMYESGYEFEKGRIKAQDENQENEISKNNEKMFNSKFEKYSGTTPKAFIDKLLDDVNINNKTNSNKKIKVVYKRIKTLEEGKIIKIKHSLGDNFKNYEVILDYDEEGYVNKVTIKDIKGSLLVNIILFISVLTIILAFIILGFIFKQFAQTIGLEQFIRSEIENLIN